MEKREEEEECDHWFNQAWPIIKTEKTWREKRLAREENGTGSSANTSDGGGNRDDLANADGE
jgi:hypothetical protein